MNDIANFLPKAAISLLKQLPNTNNERQVRSGRQAAGSEALFTVFDRKTSIALYFHRSNYLQSPINTILSTGTCYKLV
jgi:hypothetical protein